MNTNQNETVYQNIALNLYGVLLSHAFPVITQVDVQGASQIFRTLAQISVWSAVEFHKATGELQSFQQQGPSNQTMRRAV